MAVTVHPLVGDEGAQGNLPDFCGIMVDKHDEEVILPFLQIAMVFHDLFHRLFLTTVSL